MKTLLLLRHGKSSWKDSSLDDHDRPLKPRGIKAARRIGTVIRHRQIKPDIVLCSTAVRAMETIRICLEEAGLQPPVQFSRELYHCDTSQFASQLRNIDTTANTVLVVGHNPGLESFLHQLTGEAYPFPTAAMAMLELEIADWSQVHDGLRGHLIDLWQPRTLED